MRTSLYCVLMLGLLAAEGCASAPRYRTSPELLPERIGSGAIGFLPPVVHMFEEQARFGLNEAIPNDDWSRLAEDAVAKAFSEEMTADHVAVVRIGLDDLEAKELAETYSAVEFSILRHAFEKSGGEMPPREPFDEQVHTLDYSLGSAAEIMERHHIEALWIVRGFNLLPTHGAKVKHGVEVTLSILSALGGAGVPVIDLQKIQLSAALVDRSGRVVFFGVADARTALPVSDDGTHSAIDLRDARAARHYLQAALTGYGRKEAP